MTTVSPTAAPETTAGPAPAGGALERLDGTRRAALRRPGRDTWLIVEHDDLRRGELPLGLRIELERDDAGRGDSFGSQRALPSRSPGVSPRRPRPLQAWILSVVLLAVAAAGFGLGTGRVEMAYAEAVNDLDELVLALLLAWAVFNALRWTEGALLGSELSADAPWVRLRRLSVRVEPVAWRLGITGRVPAALLAVSLATLLAAMGWRDALPGASVGVAAGSVLYLLQALYPLRPGLGASVMESVFRIRELPTRLRWTLVSRFVPVPSRLDVDGSRTMVAPALATVAWAAATGAALYWISARPPGGSTLAGLLWQLVFAAVLVGYTIWLAWQAFRLVASSIELRDRAVLRAVEPSEEIRSAWARRNPLTRHLPALAGARWTWGTAPRGAVLIRYGDRDRSFLWLADGSASVVGRTPSGDPFLMAELRGGGGVGEIALLEGATRTADVIAAEDSVVAILEKDEFDAVRGDGVEERFRELVHASQSLARSRTLWGLAPDDRALWLAEGRPERYAPGDVVIRQGDDARWMGLLVRGRIDVVRDDRDLGTLDPDEVFGEIAYLDLPPRRATLTARSDVLVWRWEPDFLDRAIPEGDVRDALRRLADERTS